MDAHHRSGHSEYDWSQLAENWLDTAPQRLWRRHADAVNRGLVRRWIPVDLAATVLKTDCFDEGVGDGLYRSLAERAGRVICIDIAAALLHAARTRHRELEVVGSDSRALSFGDCSFDVVISNSSLDHFSDGAHLESAVAEIARVLKPGGRLLLTLDNLANPLIALRNALPFSWLQWTGLVPYYVGYSCGPAELRALVERCGLEVREECAILHCPRVLAVPIAGLVERLGRGRNALLRALISMERLENLPTRNRSGHFVGVLACKPSP